MKIKMLKPWGFSNPGDVIDPPRGVAIELIKAGRAVEVKDEEEKGVVDRWHKRVAKPPKGKAAQA